jgi:hypothetical protein
MYLTVLCAHMQKLDPKNDGAARDWVAIYDECSRILYEEINYVQEVRFTRSRARLELLSAVAWQLMRRLQGLMRCVCC